MKISDNIPAVIACNPGFRAVTERTSVRNYSPRPVTDEIFSALLHAAMSAPSAVNRQPWEFVAIDRHDLLRELSEALPFAKMAAHAPGAIVVCGNPARFLSGTDSELWIQDLATAAENILIAAHALGLGGVYTCLYPHIDRMEMVRRILRIDRSVIPFCLIPFGYPATDRQPFDKWHRDRIHINGY